MYFRPELQNNLAKYSTEDDINNSFERVLFDAKSFKSRGIILFLFNLLNKSEDMAELNLNRFASKSFIEIFINQHKALV